MSDRVRKVDYFYVMVPNTAGQGAKILAGVGNEFLLAAPISQPAAGLSRELNKAGVNVLSVSSVGAFARGITLVGRATLLYEARE